MDPIYLADLKFQAMSGHYKNFFRMTATDFEFLLDRIAPSIVKKNTFLRESIPIQETLALALRFFGHGTFFREFSVAATPSTPVHLPRNLQLHYTAIR
jgi:hypothetical protein